MLRGLDNNLTTMMDFDLTNTNIQNIDMINTWSKNEASIHDEGFYKFNYCIDWADFNFNHNLTSQALVFKVLARYKNKKVSGDSYEFCEHWETLCKWMEKASLNQYIKSNVPVDKPGLHKEHVSGD